MNDCSREHGEPFDMPKALEVLHQIAAPLKPAIRYQYGDTAKSNLLPPCHGYQNYLSYADAVIEQRQRAYAILDEVLARAQRRQVLKREQAS